MTCGDDKNCQCSGNSNGFVFGLILGAFIAAAIMIMSSKDKDKILKNIKKKLKFITDKITPPPTPNITSKKTNPQKITVEIPKDIETLDLTSKPAAKTQKLFKKAKK